MATVAAIATRSLKALELVIGGDAAATEDQSVAESYVLDTLRQLPEIIAGREYFDLTTPTDMTVHDDMRLLVTSASVTITCPDAPQDAARFAIIPMNGNVTLAPNARLLEGASSNVTVSSASEWMYRADLGDWRAVTTLTNASNNPYPDWAEQSIVFIAAEAMAPAFSVQLTEQMGALVNEAKAKLLARFGRPRVRQTA